MGLAETIQTEIDAKKRASENDEVGNMQAIEDILYQIIKNSKEALLRDDLKVHNVSDFVRVSDLANTLSGYKSALLKAREDAEMTVADVKEIPTTEKAMYETFRKGSDSNTDINDIVNAINNQNATTIGAEINE